MVRMNAVACNAIAEWEALPDNPDLSIPFLIRGGCSDWPALHQFTFASLTKMAGSASVRVARTSGEVQHLTLGDFIAYCRTADEPDPYYLRDWHYEDHHPEFREWMAPPALFDNWLLMLPAERRPRWSWVYAGPKNSRSSLHVDVQMSSAWNAVFSGCKEWLAFRPDHPLSVKCATARHVERLPEYDPRDAWTIRQYPGDLIYVPSGWAHSVLNIEAGVAFTENFINESNYGAVMEYLTKKGDREFRELLRNLRIIKLFQ
jgi:hypothetical protein